MTKREAELGPIFGPAIPVPRDARGRIRWGELAQEQSLFKVVVLQEAGNLIAEGGGKFNSYVLKRQGRSDLILAINRYYPEGFLGVSKALDADTAIGRKPRGYWLNPDNIRAVAAKAHEEGVEITSHKLSKAGLDQLSKAIQRNYPGGWPQVREDVGIDKSYNHPAGYWTEENLLKEAAAFLEEHNDFSHELLQKAQKYGLAVAVSRHPGGMHELRKQLNLSENVKPKGYYDDPANIEAEARSILEKAGALANKQLTQWKVANKYPGGVRALKEKLGITFERVAPDYWTVEKIQAEAETFVQEHGNLTQRALRQNGPRGLVKAIANKYPGALSGLQEFLKLNDSHKLSKEQANVDLDGLLEGNL